MIQQSVLAFFRKPDPDFSYVVAKDGGAIADVYYSGYIDHKNLWIKVPGLPSKHVGEWGGRVPGYILEQMLQVCNDSDNE